MSLFPRGKFSNQEGDSKKGFLSSHALELQEGKNAVISCFIRLPGNSQNNFRVADTFLHSQALASVVTLE